MIRELSTPTYSRVIRNGDAFRYQHHHLHSPGVTSSPPWLMSPTTPILFFFRMNARNRKVLQGGLQIEVPIVYKAKWQRVGSDQIFPMSGTPPPPPQFSTLAWDLQQADVPVSIVFSDPSRLPREPWSIFSPSSSSRPRPRWPISLALGSGRTPRLTLKSVDGLASEQVDDSTTTQRL